MKVLKLLAFSIGILLSNILLSQVKTTYKYDAMNRIIEVRFADGGSETYRYDKVGNRLGMIKLLPGDTSPPPPPPSGIKNITKDEFSIYPNPTFGVFSLEGTLVSPSDAVLKIYDLSGKEILSQTISKSSQIKQELDISKYTAGSYLLVIQYGDNKKSWTIIKQ